VTLLPRDINLGNGVHMWRGFTIFMRRRCCVDSFKARFLYKGYSVLHLLCHELFSLCILSSAVPTWTAIMWWTSKRVKRLRRLESTEDEICGGKKAEDTSVRIGEVQGTRHWKGQRIWKCYDIWYGMFVNSNWVNTRWR